MSDFQHIRTPKMTEDNKFISKLAEISEKINGTPRFEDCIGYIVKKSILDINWDEIKTLDDAKDMIDKLKVIIRQTESLIDTLESMQKKYGKIPP